MEQLNASSFFIGRFSKIFNIEAFVLYKGSSEIFFSKEHFLRPLISRIVETESLKLISITALKESFVKKYFFDSFLVLLFLKSISPLLIKENMASEAVLHFMFSRSALLTSNCVELMAVTILVFGSHSHPLTPRIENTIIKPRENPDK